MTDETAVYLTEALNAIPPAWTLMMHAGRPATASGPAPTTFGSKLPLDADLLSTREAVRRELAFWAATYLVDTDMPGKVDTLDAPLIAIWLANRTHWLATTNRRNREGETATEAIYDCHRRVLSIANPKHKPPENTVGTCPACKLGDLTKKGGSIECARCHKRADVWEWWELRYPDLARDVTALEIAKEYDVTVEVVYQWVKRKGLTPVTGPRVRPVLYRWAQVRWILDYASTLPKGTQSVAEPALNS